MGSRIHVGLARAVLSDEESGALLEHDNREQNHAVPYARKRPRTRIRYGFLKLKSKKVDAIDLFEEQLKRLDEKIKVTREKEFKPTALAFVTMDSVPACVSAHKCTGCVRHLTASLANGCPSDT